MEGLLQGSTGRFSDRFRRGLLFQGMQSVKEVEIPEMLDETD
jgi:hypothetical protein